MRITSVLLKTIKNGKTGRRPQNPNKVPFQEILPLRLKNRVSGKVDSGTEVACLQELTILFASLKNNDFDESKCNKEITTLKKNYKEVLDKNYAEKNTDSKILATGRVLNSQQINKYLKGFPNPK